MNIDIAVELIRNLPSNEKKNIIDMLYKEDVKETMLILTRRLEGVEERQHITESNVKILSISDRDKEKRIVTLEQQEKSRGEINDGWKEASTIAAYLFPGNTVLKTMSAQLINIFYFAFGLRGKNGVYAKRYISGQREAAIKKDFYFYQDEKKAGNKMLPYWPGNVKKIKELFDKKLTESGFYNDFYNATDMKDIEYIAAYLACVRLNKYYGCLINLSLPKKELMREYKKSYNLGDFIDELTDIELS